MFRIKRRVWFILYVACCVPVRTNQQAPLRQRHSQVQTGSEGLLQAGQRAATNHSVRIQRLPAGRVEGNVHFPTKSRKTWHCEGRRWFDERLFPFQKHENEFNDAAALKEIYKFIERYFTEVSHLHVHTDTRRFVFVSDVVMACTF